MPTLAGEVTAGALVGIAGDSESFVPVDTEARSSSGGGGEGGSGDPRGRQLREILQQSTDGFMLANDDADQEYYRELMAMGYDNEDVEKKMQERGREYHGMLRMGCLRRPQLSPVLIKLPSRVRVASIAAGYAHTMLLTTEGQLYACGYNDRGQLGLGHRINTSKFKNVAFMEGKTVLQVVCGQQHTVARAIDPRLHPPSTVDKAPGADVYVFGNGALGQLGLGLRGTSKGRLLPTLVPHLASAHPLGVVDIAAGGYFSMAVVADGAVYGFGHSEYNQMASMTSDAVNPYYYYVPRQIPVKRAVGPGTDTDTGAGTSHVETDNGATGSLSTPAHPPCPMDADDARIVKVSCGFNFTVAIDDHGECYSWGWNEGGVLGRGAGYYNSIAEKVGSLGQEFVERGRVVIAIAAGSKHVLAMTRSSRHEWALTYRGLLDSGRFADVAIVVDGPTSDDCAVFHTHSVLLAARCPYFKGFLRSAVGDQPAHSTHTHPTHPTHPVKLIEVTLPSEHATPATVRSLLEYLYLDRLTLPAHKRAPLRMLASDLRMDPLVALCATSIGDHPPTDTALSSTFLADLSALVDDPSTADVLLTLACDAHHPPISTLYAHKAILSKVPYFEALFANNFLETTGETIQGGALRTVGLVSEGMDFSDFHAFVHYIYTGQFCRDPTDDDEVNWTGLLVLADRLQFESLSTYCERQLSAHLQDYPENAVNVLEFARTYQFARLERQCVELTGEAVGRLKG